MQSIVRANLPLHVLATGYHHLVATDFSVTSFSSVPALKLYQAKRDEISAVQTAS